MGIWAASAAWAPEGIVMEKITIRYIDEINAFHGWVQINPIPSSARLVWFSLMHWCNRTGWKKEFNLAMSLIESDTGLSRRTIERARTALQEEGLIEVRQRSGNQSPIYKIIPLSVRHNDAQSVAQSVAKLPVRHNDAQSVAQSVAQSDHIPRHKDIDVKTFCKAAAATRANKNNGIQQEGIYDVVQSYCNNIHPIANEVERDDLADLTDDFGSEWVIMAIREAARQRAGSINYVKAILRRWRQTGDSDPWNHDDRKKHSGGSRGSEYDAIEF